MRRSKIILTTIFTLLISVIVAGSFTNDPMKGTAAAITATAAIAAPIADSKSLKEEKGKIWERAQEMLESAKAENRDFDEKEAKDYDNLLKQMRELDLKIKRAEETERRLLEMAGSVHNKANEEREKKEVKRYSLLRAIRLKAEGRELDGFEKEMHDEAVKEAREGGMSITGIGVPSLILNPQEKRDYTAGTDADGGYTIPTQLTGFIEALRAKLLVSGMGANVMTGLKGNIDIPKQSAASSAGWAAENDTATETKASFSKISLTPHRLAAYSDISKQLINQSSLDVERFVQNDLLMAVKIAVDLAAINGSGSSNQPTGILNTTGIGSVAGGTNGAAPTLDHLIDLEKEVAVDNADVGTLAFLTNPNVRAKLKKTKADDGSGIFVWPNDGKLLGYNTGISTQVPNNLTKGTGTNLSAIIFGNFSDLIIAQFGGLDIVVDPYTQATSGLVRLVINSYWDIAVRHPESFAAMVDAITEA